MLGALAVVASPRGVCAEEESSQGQQRTLQQSHVQQEIPDLTLRDSVGRQHSLVDYRGKRFARSYKMDFPILLEATTDHMRGLGLGEAVPSTAFIDRDGHIVARILGQATRGDVVGRVVSSFS